MTVGCDADATVSRVGARLIILDDADRVLLINETYDDGSEAGRWRHWLTPGGGVEPGESLASAASREVFEETGMRIELGPGSVEVHRDRRAWSWAGVTYDQVDHYFAARVAAPFDVHPGGLTEMERQTVKGARWWTESEILASADVFVPPDLGPVLTGLLAPGGGPRRPVGRRAGRVLVLDADGRVLLILTRQGVGVAATNWIAPGGGVESGETPAGAARRELAEETGIRVDLAPDAEPVLTERAVFAFGDVLLDQTDEYFVHRVTQPPEVLADQLSPIERQTVVDYRWWAAAEIEASPEVFWPAGLADLLRELTPSDTVAGPGSSGSAA